MISATKKSRTKKALTLSVCLSGRGVSGDLGIDADSESAARPKNKRTTGETKSSNAATLAGRAKTKRRAGDHRRVTEITHSGSAKPKRGRGEICAVADVGSSASAQTNGHARVSLPTVVSVRGPAGGGDKSDAAEHPFASACLELQELQRQAVSAMKSRLMISNRAVSGIALAMGYQANMDEAERKKHWDKAAELFKLMRKGQDIPAEYAHVGSILQMLTANISLAIDGFEAFEDGLNKAMIAIVKTLPIADWINEPEQRGIAELSVARIIGEAGDLANYSGPYKLYKRMGLMPYNGKMPSTWRGSKPGLSAEEWTNLGYSPRRRSVVWNIGECIVKANQTGPYRKRYDDAKADFKAKHEGCKDGHANNHAKLVASKEFVKQLWKQWNKA